MSLLLGRPSRRAARFVLSALLFLAAPALAQEAPTAGRAATSELIAEIEAWGESDQSKDPEGDLIKLQDLQRRVDSDGNVPPIERGLLASAFGGAHFYANRYDRAVEYITEAARLFEEGNAPPDEIAGLHNNQATILASLGRYSEAEASHLKALAIRRQIEGERGPAVSSSLFGLGYVYYRQGRIEESIPYFRDSVEQQLEFNGEDDPLAIMRLASLASVLSRSGRELEGLQIARQAEALALEHLGDTHPTYAIALNNLGNALIENGRYQEAISVLRETLRVRVATVGEGASGTAISLRNLAAVLKHTGALEEAEELNRRAIAIFEANDETDVPDGLAYMYADLASLAADRGDLASYEALAQRSMEEADRRLGDGDYNRAQVHLYHAEHLRRQRRIGEALEIAERWVPVMQSALIPDHKDRINAELLLARLRQQLGRASEAISLAEVAVGALTSKLADLSATDRQLVRDAATNRESALLYFEIATAANDPDGAFTALQLANISDLALSQQLASEDLEEAEGRGWTVTVDRMRGLRWHTFDAAEMAAHARALRRAVDRPSDLSQFPAADAAALYRLLLPDGVHSDGKLLVHGGRLLASLPLSLLLTSEWSGSLAEAPWLIRRASVQVVGNLALHVRQRGSMAAPLAGEMRMAGIGGADLSPSDEPDSGAVSQLASLFRSGRPAIDSISALPPLPGAAEELRAIAAALPGFDDLILLGSQAAEENLKQADLSDVRVLAFATHGLVSGELRDLWEPALLLGTAEGSGEDGLLGASEIAALKLDADWVILSACNTAAGDDAGAPAYSGLAAAFAQAGARSLMLSHWRVRDDAAARLSVGTVRGAATGLSRAEALRQAQLELLADTSVPGAAHPAIWAPFVIVEN